MSRQSTRHFDGSRVRKARQDQNLTHEDLARAVNVTLRTVQRWQDNEGEPSGAKLLLLAEVLRVQPDFFYVEPERVPA